MGQSEKNSAKDLSPSFSTYTAEQIQQFRTRWEQAKSASKRYDPSFDIFDDFAEEKILEQTEEHWINTFFKFSVAGISILLGALALFLSYLNPEIQGFNPEHSTLDNVLFVISFGGLSRELTENNFLLFAALSFAALVIDRLRVTLRADHARIRIRRSILRERQALKYRKQIYPGVGPVRFSAGEDGLAIQGDNLDMLFQWGSLDSEFVFVRRDRQTKEFEFVADDWMIKDAISDEEELATEAGSSLSDSDRMFALHNIIRDATHLWILLKPTWTFEKFLELENSGEQTGPYAEFFVIPHSFFEDPRAGESWDSFCLFLLKSRLAR